MQVDLPGIGIVEFPDGTPDETIAQAYDAFMAATEPRAPNVNPGVAPEAPAEMFYNPNTGQYTSRELLGNRDIGGLEAFAYGGAHGSTFGGIDEAAGAVNALIPGKGTAAERYTFGRELSRALEEAAREQHPVASGVGEATGAISTALTYGLPSIASRGLGGAMLANAGVGAAEGVGYGLLSGEGGFIPRSKEALRYGLLGAGVGAAAPLATSAVRRIGTAAGDFIGGGVDRALGRGSQSRANRAIAATVERSGKSIDDLDAALAAAAREGQPEYRIADALGTAGQRRLSGIARSGGDLSQEVTEFLNTRQLGQPERVAAFIEEGFDMGGDSAAARSARFVADRAATARTEYEAARKAAGPVNLNAAIDKIDELLNRDPIIGETALRETEMGRRLLGIRNQLQKGGEQLIDFGQVLDVKQDLGGVIARINRSGDAVPAPIATVYGELDKALENASGLYRAANDHYREASLVIDAIERGQTAARPGARAIDTTAEFAAMTPDQQAAARAGYGDVLLRRAEAGRPGANRADPLLTPKVREEIAAMAVEPETLARRIGRESDMFETRFRALGGSRTADNQMDIADMQGFDIGLLGNLLTGNFRAASQRAGAQLGNLLSGMNENTRKIVAQAMMARDTDALRKALDQAATEAERAQIVDILLRVGSMHAGSRHGLLQ